MVAVSDGVAYVRPGDRVVATYGHRTATCVRADGLMRVPEGVPDEVALLAVLSNDASKGVGKLGLNPDDAVLITGAGTIGLLTLHRLRWLGFANVDVVESSVSRRELALELGARAASPPDALNRGDYEAGVECSSRRTAFSQLQRHVRPGGQLCILADGNLEPFTFVPEFHVRELSVVASSDGEDYPGHAAAFFAYWLGARAPLAKLFTWRVSARDLPETFERMLTDPPLKVFVSYP